MLSSWYATDPDCCQHIRYNGSHYEMIQCVWLDTTEEDLAEGKHQYCIVNMNIDLNDYSDAEKAMYISTYGYTLEGLIDEYGDDVNGIIAECIMETDILSDSHVIGSADTFEEAQEKIMKIMFQK